MTGAGSRSQIQERPSRDWVDAFFDAGVHSIPPEIVRPPITEERQYTADELHLPQRMGGKDPLISVIVPTHRDSQYLPDALVTVGAQTYRNIEVIVVDSSSVDWVERLASEREWIRYCSNTPDGVSAARNSGIEMASGTYVAFLDADDYWHPNKLSRQVDALEDGGATSFTGYYFLNYWRMDAPAVTVEDRHPTPPEFASREVLSRAVDAHTSTLLIRRSEIPARPFHEELENFEDVVFAVECFEDHPPRHVTDPLVVRRLRPGSLADRTTAIEKARYRITGYEYLAEHHPHLRQNARRMIGREQHRIGVAHLQQNQRRSARRAFAASLRHHPTNLRTLALYGLSFVPVDSKSLFTALESAFTRRSSISSIVEIAPGGQGQHD